MLSWLNSLLLYLISRGVPQRRTSTFSSSSAPTGTLSCGIGADEDENVEVRRWGTPRQFDFEAKAHWDLGEDLDILDWERGAKVTGARFLFYKGLGARLERAIYNFMLDEHGKEGYTEVITPYMVNHDSMFGTGQYPKFKEDTFELSDTNFVLIPTAEVPLTNYYRDEILDGKELPIYFTAMSPSFRSEAAAVGIRTKLVSLSSKVSSLNLGYCPVPNIESWLTI